MSRRFTLALPVAAILLIGACSAGSTPAPAPPTLGRPAPAASASSGGLAPSSPSRIPDEAVKGEVEIGGGRHLYLECEGSGPPTVIFDAGLGTGLGSWSTVSRDVSGFARACAYDRAGIGRSSAVHGTRTTDDVVTDLHALVVAAGLQPPFVLVAHSIGGFTARLYAGRYPAELAGEVYVDPAVPHQVEELLAAVPKDTLEDPAVRQLRAAWSHWPEPGDTSEHYDIGASEAAVDSVASFGDLPVIVLTAAGQGDPGLPARVRDALLKRWIELHEELARLSTRGEQRIVRDAPHAIQDTQPDVVVEGIRDVVEMSRGG